MPGDCRLWPGCPGPRCFNPRPAPRCQATLSTRRSAEPERVSIRARHLDARRLLLLPLAALDVAVSIRARHLDARRRRPWCGRVARYGFNPRPAPRCQATGARASPAHRHPVSIRARHLDARRRLQQHRRTEETGVSIRARHLDARRQAVICSWGVMHRVSIRARHLDARRRLSGRFRAALEAFQSAPGT